MCNEEPVYRVKICSWLERSSIGSFSFVQLHNYWQIAEASGFEVLTIINLKSTFFWNVTPFRLV
jgi:hypothetical protein